VPTATPLCLSFEGMLGTLSSQNVLLTSVGRRVALARFFKEVLGGRGYVFGADCDPTAPGLYVVDKGFIVPRVTAEEYISSLLDICRRESVKLIVPLIDPELPILAMAREFFLQEGILPLVSTYDVVMIGYDKLLTAKFFSENGIPTPKTALFEKAADFLEDYDFPVIIKPRFGSASVGVCKCASPEEAKFYASRIPDPIIQTCLSGEEITIDVLCDFQGNPLSIVERKRLKVRAGEVERGITIKDESLLKMVLDVVAKLKPLGVINLQCFSTPEGFIFTEINARFGGGYPLSHFAGVNFPKTILEMVEGKKPEVSIFSYKEDFLMLRYDDAIYLGKEDLLS